MGQWLMRVGDLFEFKQPVAPSTKVVLGIAAWCLLLLGWHWAATWGGEVSPLFPGPLQVLGALRELFFERGFASDVWSSLTRIGISFALAALIAIPLGVLMGSFASVSAFFNPLVSAFRYLPAPAFIPLLLMWLGTGDEQKIALLMLGVIWFLITLVSDVTSQVPQDFIETSKTLGGSKRIVLWTVVVRSALPGIVDTCRQMMAVSWTYLVIAEIVAATDGIGAMMMRARRFVHVDEIMAGIVVIGVLGLLCDLAFRALHWWWFPYLRRRGNQDLTSVRPAGLLALPEAVNHGERQHAVEQLEQSVQGVCAGSRADGRRRRRAGGREG